MIDGCTGFCYLPSVCWFKWSWSESAWVNFRRPKNRDPFLLHKQNMFRCSSMGPRFVGIPKSSAKSHNFVHFQSSKPITLLKSSPIYTPTIRTFHVSAPLLRFIGSKTKDRRVATRISKGVYQSPYFKPGPTSPYYALTQIDPVCYLYIVHSSLYIWLSAGCTCYWQYAQHLINMVNTQY